MASRVVVDVEDESILASIFKEAFPENWKDNTEFAQYLAELSSYGISRLGREPDRLAEERSQILEQTQDLAFHNYRTFIQTADCGREIFQDVIEKHVNSMLYKLPELNRSCEEFTKRAQEINASRKTNNLTLVKHPQLLEFLEIPQLMDTCVRNSYYEEALELMAYAKRLEKKYASISVILNIVNEVKKSAQLMLNQLIHQLRMNIQLPACLRVIGYLRRMDVFTEAELRIKFLQARDAWFQSVLSSIPSEEPYHHISKTIELTRVHLFDIITQYRAIFSDDEIMNLSNKDEKSSESLLFHGWIIQKVSHFLCTLKNDLNCGIGGRLDSVLGQCMYFGLSFSRVGADFRGLIAPIFQQAALTAFSKAIEDAELRFDEILQSYTLLGTHAVGSSIAYGLTVQIGINVQPPTALLDFQPLAVYCNSVLHAFNDLRLCAPISLACDVAAKLEESLHKTTDCILAYHRIDETSFSPQELERFGQMCHLFVRELIPFLNRCLQVLFPPLQLGMILGISASDLTREQIGLVNVRAFEEAFQHLLPALTPANSSTEQNFDMIQNSDEDQHSDVALVESSKENDLNVNNTVQETVPHEILGTAVVDELEAD